MKGFEEMKKGSGEDKLKKLPPTTISTRTTEGNETGDWRYRRPVLDINKCNRCGLCWMYCPDTAIRPSSDRKSYELVYKYCKGCGICAVECPKGAISLENEER